MKRFWEAVCSWLGFVRERRGHLRWLRIDEAKQTEFFRWFAFTENEVAKDESGNTVISFRPEGRKFRSLVKLDVVLGEQDHIAALHLSLVKSFVDDDSDGIFARDIAKSLLRSALPEPDAGSIAILADEIEYRHNFPVLTRRPFPQQQLPPQPSEGFLTYIGRQQLYEEAFSRSSLKIEQARTKDGEAVVITIRAVR